MREWEGELSFCGSSGDRGLELFAGFAGEVLWEEWSWCLWP